MKLLKYIDHDWQMTPIDFQVTRSKVKFTVTKTYSQWLPLQLTAHRGACMFYKQPLFCVKIMYTSALNKYVHI
jgi:hypothetical protein